MEQHDTTRHHGFKSYIPVDVALDKFLSYMDISKLLSFTENVDLGDALGRVLADDLLSDIDVPPFIKAAMDGYAVLSKDTKGASSKQPILLDVIDSISAGQDVQSSVVSGKAVAVATGGMIPDGGDAVVIVENTELVGNKVKIMDEVEQGKNLALKGEEVSKGQILLEKGTWLDAQDLGLVASVGVDKIPVLRKPKVAVIATGSELIEPGSKPGPGQIFESNRHVILGMVKEFGGEVVDMGICRDEWDLISSKLRAALRFDVVVVSGGSSVGEKDFIPNIIGKMGKPGLLVHGVAMKPGSPTALGILDNKPIIVTPGFPVSSYFAFYAFGRPLLFHMLKTKGPPTPTINARMLAGIDTHEGMRTFVRVKISRNDNCYFANPISATGARVLSTLTNSDGIVIVDDLKRLEKNEEVNVILLRSL